MSASNSPTCARPLRFALAICIALPIAATAAPHVEAHGSGHLVNGVLLAQATPAPSTPKAAPGKTTVIEHPNGDMTIVKTAPNGDHNVRTAPANGAKPGGGQYGSGRSHGEVVRDQMQSGSRIVSSSGGGAGGAKKNMLEPKVPESQK
jgi:hypothetical protein